MHCSTSSNLSRASVMFVTSFAFFASVCIGVPAAGSSASLPEGSCAANRTYKVQPKDSCMGISLKQNVSTMEIMYLNCLKSDGTDLQANATIKLPGCCSTYNVKPGDNCTSVASTHDLSLPKFREFNPLINHNCTNLEAGYNVCLTAPQGTPSKECRAKSSTSGTSAGTRKPYQAPDTSTDCTKHRVAALGDACDTLAPGLPTARFVELNPSVHQDCSNLVAGQRYCVSAP